MPKINQLNQTTSLSNTDVLAAENANGANTRKIAYASLRTQIQNESRSVFALHGEIASDEQVATAASDWLNSHVTPTGSTVALDDTLLIQGAASDAKATGEMIVINGSSSNSTRVNITTTDTDVQLALMDDLTDFEDTIGGELIVVNSDSTDTTRVNITTSETDIELAEKSEVDDLKNAFDYAFIAPKNLYNPDDPNVLNNKYMNTSGVISDYNNRTITGYMPVTPGKKLVISRVVNGTQEAFSWAALCLFDSAKQVVSGGTYNQSGLTIPSGVVYVRGTMTATYPDVQFELRDDTNFTEYEPFHLTLSDDVVIPDVETLESVASDTTRDVETLESVASDTTRKESLSISDNIEPDLTFTTGYMNLNGEVNTSTTTLQYSNKISVSEGDVLTTGSAGFRFVTAFNSSTAVSESGVNGSPTSPTSYTVPSGINYVVVTTYISHSGEGINLIHVSDTYENTIKANIEPNLRFTSGYYMAPNGTTAVGTTLKYSNKIPVKVGDVIETDGIGFRFITAFSGDSAVQASGTQNVTKYTVPDNIDSVVLTLYISHTGEGVLITTTESNYNHIITKRIAAGYMSGAATLASGETIKLPTHNVKNGNRYVFNANISSLSSIKISKGTPCVTVNATTVSVTSDLGGMVSFNHGLTISHDITIDIEEGESLYLSRLRIVSAGNVYDAPTSPVIRFNADSGTPTAESVGSSLTECRFSWTSRNAEKPIWFFGDSYFSWYPQRWTYHAAQDQNLDGCLLNGYAGQTSASAITSLYNLLSVYIPKTVVWCLGMNDGDTSSAVNASWKTVYDKLVSMSKEYGFELVLYTTPTTPTINNSFKNEIVRNSGLRYIEADKAVRINDSGAWVSGALSDDNVHPTEEGAKILYCRILADFPEIMCK